MAVSPAKENILKRIRQALSNPVPLPFAQSEGTSSVFPPASDDLGILFAQEFTALQGKFAFCIGEDDMRKQVQQLIAEKEWTRIYCDTEPWKDSFSNTISLATCDASITGCEFLVARTGTMVMSAAQQSGRTVSVYAPVHICIAYTSQLVYDIKDALQSVKDKYNGNIPSLVTFATGPSRTADIEKTLVTGVHGPKEVYCFLVEA
ncbi:MAG TPA: lactate utilization protein [Ferruginibacter sp.]|jgi:L-lactate dehydrogenase complex protein LldG|nr:lactate utilization protein [Ferruginibacter sp.]MBN8698448.1 lactate utilization protein [Chitinophagales bacterium]HMU72294.1 lactate utilization protein [Ferruginibacter sp.]HMZ99864.1 lactate utilization protein [Ferruginibacter sp.]HNG63733.1 lactate utilization protein [Ferruginibacter sp.]